LREPLGVIDILIACDAGVDGPTEQVCQWRLGILVASGVGQVPGNEFAEAQPFIKFTHQNKAAIRGAG
jgi:hypothetical protein